MDESGTDARVAGWDEVATSYGTGSPVFAHFAEALVELAAVKRGESALDLGTGNGLSLLPAAWAAEPGRV